MYSPSKQWKYAPKSQYHQHRYKTRVQMGAKMSPHLQLLCWLFMGPTLGFDTKQRNSFLIKFGGFLQQKQDSDNIIHS
jgi:hypothetical protein